MLYLLRVAFGIYVHIPYCLQRCIYCDFATYEVGKIDPPEKYFELLKAELRAKHSFITARKLRSVYFGGGTPSLVDSKLISDLLTEMKALGFDFDSETEVTIEINPATVSEPKLSAYLDSGVNRFSVGAQTFDEGLLKKAGRKHDAHDTIETLELLAKHGLNFNADLLFALPGQTLDVLSKDLDHLLNFNPSHISPYCLTVPSNNPLFKGRPSDEVQVEMFSVIERALLDGGFQRYEISNYSKPNKESKHNLLYWNNDEYWGLGLSAHSYLDSGDWGVRFWNASSYRDYRDTIERLGHSAPAGPTEALHPDQFEILTKRQALTDFCHTSLRLDRGLSMAGLKARFGAETLQEVQDRAQELLRRGLVQNIESFAQLTHEGRLLSNLVFEHLTFLAEEPLG